MKYIFVILLCITCISFTYAQQFSQKVGVNATLIEPSAALEVESITKGFLPPRMTQVQMNAIVSPATGLIVYCTDCTPGGLRVFDGTSWVDLCNGASSISSVYVNCSSSGFFGNYVNGIALTSSNKFSITITNNSFTAVTIAFQTSDLVLSGVSGIAVSSVSIPSVTLNTGQSQVVEYTLSGTPTSVGTLTGTWTKLALNCTKTVAVTNPAITSLNCAGTTHNGTLTSGTVASGVSSVIGYTGGDGSAYSGQTIASTGVTGLTATLTAGNFATGAGSLTYTITGTPSAGGTASFAINIGGQSCILTRTVAFSITIPTSITLGQNQNYYVVSVFDQDYLPYTAPSGAATTNTQAADGTNEAATVNVQGTITTSGVNIKIPVSATGSDTLPAFSSTITIPSSMTEDGISRDLTLSWASQAYTTGTTSIDATISAVAGTLNAKKLDVNAGIGNDVLGVLMGQFTYPYNNAGNTTTFSVRDIAAIPDKMFGLPDNTGDSTTHMMLYLPTVAEDGKIWLNNNLGAHYANLNHSSFNPAQQATNVFDYLAYGSLFQWGRKGDGHELITWTNSSTGAPVNGVTTTNSDSPINNLFVTPINSPWDWRTTLNDGLWANESSLNNPCPHGYRVPTNSELNYLVSSSNIIDSFSNNNASIKFPYAGYRLYSDLFNGALVDTGNIGFYWKSSTINHFAFYRAFFNSNSSSNEANYRAMGYSVRCIID